MFNCNNRCNSCSPCQCPCGRWPTVTPVSYLERCTCQRYVDVPMNIYYGAGFTEVECCEETLEVLQEISTSLKAMAPQNRCNNGCNNRCNNRCC